MLGIITIGKFVQEDYEYKIIEEDDPIKKREILKNLIKKRKILAREKGIPIHHI